MEGVTKLIHDIKDNLMHLRMKRAVTLAIQTLRVRPAFVIFGLDGRCLVKLRILSKKRVGLLCPRLVTQKVDVRDEPDTVLPADRD